MFILSRVGQASVLQPSKFTPDPEHFPVSSYVQLQMINNFVSDTLFLFSLVT